jgi:hypothetical protein
MKEEFATCRQGCRYHTDSLHESSAEQQSTALPWYRQFALGRLFYLLHVHTVAVKCYTSTVPFDV